jgi:uncharacterized protein
MVLDVSKLAKTPGAAVSFEREINLDGLLSESVAGFVGQPRVSGVVKNEAGRMTLRAQVDAVAVHVCARCLRRFESPMSESVSVTIVREEDSGQEDLGMYVIGGDRLSPDEIILSELVLGADYAVLCDEDCKGLCQVCGADLNEGDCGCQKPPDPRLAALAALLE